MNLPDAARSVELYKAMVANIRASEQTILKLMRHPEATAEQILAVHKQYVGIYRSTEDVRGKLREKFPDRTLLRPYPWNTKGTI